MSNAVFVDFDNAPAFGPIYRKVLFGKLRPGFRAGDTMPRLGARCRGVRVNGENLTAYRQVCHIPEAPHLPPLYPHVMTGSLHLAIMTMDDFPLSMMGAVHLRNHVLEHRRLRADEAFDVACELASHRIAKAGIELDVTTKLTDASGALAWESISTYLVRGKFGEPGTPPERAEVPEGAVEHEVAGWPVPPGTGRRYAKVCGDYNPIHISPITAKLFGFKRDIAHGMWVAAVSLAKLGDLSGDAPVRCDILFKGPTFMNSKVRLLKGGLPEGERFELYCGGNPKPSIVGWRRMVAAGAGLE